VIYSTIQKNLENKGEKTEKMAEEKLGGNIMLAGFELEPIEVIVVKKIVGTYVKKLSENANYKSLKVTLKQHEHAKSFMHEIQAEAIITEGKTEKNGRQIRIATSSTQRNLFAALDIALKKILHEAEHKARTTKEFGEEMIRKEEKQKQKEK